MLQIGPTNRSKELFSSHNEDILECCGNECCKNFEVPKQFTSSPHFWLWLCLAMFVISSTSTLSLHLTLISNRSGPFHKFLKIFSTGPLQTTQFIQGIIVPKIVYRNQNTKSLVKTKKKRMEILNVEELLNCLKDGSKIISESNPDSVEMRNNHQSSTNILKAISTIELPLSPKYHPTRIVPQVWDRRYHPAIFENIVYPPGFVDV